MSAASIPGARAKSRRPAGSRSRVSGARRGASPGAGVRWDRIGRMAMLCVLGALLYLYLSAGLSMLSTLHQSSADRAKVSAMEHEHSALVRQHQELSQPGTLEAQARQLGMMRPGEQPYVVTGLPGN